MIQRSITKEILDRINGHKAIILFGSRQVGKTTLVNAIGKTTDKPIVYFNGDEPDDRELLSNTSSSALRNLIGRNKLVIIDEAQRITNIGLTIKLIVDQLKDIKVIATGSSSFELANEINEPLTGRKWEYQVYPLSIAELINHFGLREENRLLEQRLIYGFYPEVVTNPGNEEEILKSLSNSLLYKDILTIENIKKPAALEKLVQSLAFQIGSEVSLNELSQQAGIDYHTVARYLDLLQKTYIIFSLGSLSGNLRNEIKKNRKYYFFDNGLRNAVIRQFQPLNIRNDVGALWENFVLSERLKRNQDKKHFCNQFFWRTHAQQEIDYIEEYNGKVDAFEFKYSAKKSARFSQSFLKAYPIRSTKTIHKENYLEFVAD